MNHPILHTIAAVAVFLMVADTALAEGTFEGRKKCYNCHKSQGESWDKTLHAKAIESLKPNHGRGKTQSQARSEERLHQG